jgi:hypothetical protein
VQRSQDGVSGGRGHSLNTSLGLSGPRGCRKRGGSKMAQNDEE